MKAYIERAVQNQLHAFGMKKLPPAVVATIIEIVSVDMAAALAKSVTKRTKPRALARAFAECVMGVRGEDSKGASPFGQLCPANASETRTLIGTHSDTDDELLKKEIRP